MHLDHDQLNQLLDKLAESDIQEFRLEGDDFRLEVRRNLPVSAAATQMVPVAAAPVPALEIKTQSESSSAAPPAAALYSKISPGAAWAVSAPIAKPYSITSALTKP